MLMHCGLRYAQPFSFFKKSLFYLFKWYQISQLKDISHNIVVRILTKVTVTPLLRWPLLNFSVNRHHTISKKFWHHWRTCPTWSIWGPSMSPVTITIQFLIKFHSYWTYYTRLWNFDLTDVLTPLGLGTIHESCDHSHSIPRQISQLLDILHNVMKFWPHWRIDPTRSRDHPWVMWPFPFDSLANFSFNRHITQYKCENFDKSDRHTPSSMTVIKMTLPFRFLIKFLS